MLLPSKKDLKTAMEVFAIFQWALSAFLIGESSGFCRVTNHPGLPRKEGFGVVRMFNAHIEIVNPG